MFCRNCGTQLSNGQKFCQNCGTERENLNNNNNNNVSSQSSTVQSVQPGFNNHHVEQHNNIYNHNERMQNNTMQSHEQPNFNNQRVEQHNNNYGNMQNHVMQSQNQQFYNNNQMNNMNRQTNKKKKSGTLVIFIIIGAVILFFVGIIGLVTMLFLNVSNNSNKLICKSKEGNITLMYDETGIIGYTQKGISYDLDSQQEYAKTIGINAYLDEFTEWFENNTTGTCTIQELNESSATHDKDKDIEIEEENDTADLNTKTVGDSKYGYVSIPNKWVKFKDLDGSTSLQYSDVTGSYIVTLDYVENSTMTAKEAASKFLSQMQQSSEVTGVKGSTVYIGKNKEYKAYQVYMLYQAEGIYLVTYWFETESGAIRYLALEGPTEVNGVKLTDYLYIPESFSLKK